MTRLLILTLLLCAAFNAPETYGAEPLNSKTTYSKAYGETKNAVAVDAAKDLPRYPAVEPRDAIATWKVKPGFKLELAAHEPQVRDPIAICFDENGRMFVCEMIDYSEMRDATPHLGRISMLEDKDGDGHFETSTVFADNLPWPTGLIWAQGGLYVGATPDIWRFEDRDGDGRAEVREKIFTGFGTGLKLLNVQGLLNSFQWGPDSRVHVLAGGGNRGLIKCLRRPDLPTQELSGRDFWFDPRTHAFGFETGGAQYGMSFDNYGRKFGCSNSDHLQLWHYDGKYAERNPFSSLPPSRQSIAADRGAAEVFRISPDEPWRIIRTRWRVAGVVKGAIEGGGRVSGYFTGATGTTVYRGDAYGADFVNNTFTGDAGGQLVHRKKIFDSGASLLGRRADDEKGFEFAASKDTWVRAVNFANAPDGCLYLCDMYREVIEHPWSIPDEIKKHLDLNSGHDRGRIYRITPEDKSWQRRPQVSLGKASSAELVQTLAHPNGWHRDTAARLLYERQDPAAVPLLSKLVNGSPDALARFHALGVLAALNALREEDILAAIADSDAHVRERAITLAPATPRVVDRLLALVADANPRVRFQLALTSGDLASEQSAAALAELGTRDVADPWISAAVLSSPPPTARAIFDLWRNSGDLLKPELASMVDRLIFINAASAESAQRRELIEFVAATPRTSFLRALGEGLRRAGTTIEKADPDQLLAPVFIKAAGIAADPRATAVARVEAIELLGLNPLAGSRVVIGTCLGQRQPENVQRAAVQVLTQHFSPEVAQTLLDHWPGYGPSAKEATMAALVSRPDGAAALLTAIQGGSISPSELSLSHVQNLVQHQDAGISVLAKSALVSVIPPSRAEMVAKFQPAVTLQGEATRGQAIYQGRCFSCHRAGGLGMEVGPDLVTVKTKGREALLSAILEPHKEVASQYIAYTVTTHEDQMLQGIITKDDASSVTVRMAGGAEVNLPRAQIRGSSSGGQSLMPEGLEAGLDAQGMADLLTFIEELP
jgi:putative membrane-bound dehydrogenase-like protein